MPIEGFAELAGLEAPLTEEDYLMFGAQSFSLEQFNQQDWTPGDYTLEEDDDHHSDPTWAPGNQDGLEDDDDSEEFSDEN